MNHRVVGVSFLYDRTSLRGNRSTGEQSKSFGKLLSEAGLGVSWIHEDIALSCIVTVLITASGPLGEKPMAIGKALLREFGQLDL